MATWWRWVLILLVFSIPLFVRSYFALHVAIMIAINVVAVAGFGVLVGYAGQFSLAHGAFFGVGAYTAGILAQKYQVPFVIALLAGALVPAIIAYAIGRPVLALKSFYLAIVTLALAQIIQRVFVEEQWLTGGAIGMWGIPAPSVAGVTLDKPVAFYYVYWVLAVGLLWFSFGIVRGKFGRALRTIAEDEAVASAMGIDVPRTKLYCFVLSAFYAGISGAAFAYYMQYIGPDMFTLSLAVSFLIMLVAGGTGSVWGAVLGTFVITLIPELTRTAVRYHGLIFGLILLLIMMFLPDGALGAAKALRERTWQGKGGTKKRRWI